MKDFYKIAEDHVLRSDYIKNLVQFDEVEKVPQIISEIPKNIIQYWHDEDEIPKDVRECLESWKTLENKGFYINLFSDKKAKIFIGENFSDKHLEAFNRCHHPAMRCDFFRLSYILLNGGFYVDADEVFQEQDCSFLFQNSKLKIQPLCYDKSTGLMIEPKRFMFNREYSEDWIFYVNNNPIIAPANHPLISLAHQRATDALLSTVNRLDIQETTGPGNLSACLVLHSCQLNSQDKDNDFQILNNWEQISYSKWPLSYRNDERNWRLWKL